MLLSFLHEPEIFFEKIQLVLVNQRHYSTVKSLVWSENMHMRHFGEGIRKKVAKINILRWLIRQSTRKKYSFLVQL